MEVNVSNKRQRMWIVRGFDVSYIEDDEYGIDDPISSFNNFSEVLADNFVDVFEKLSSSSFNWMRQSRAIELQKNHNSVVMNEKPRNEFYTMRVSITFKCSYEELRANKHNVIESIKRWAEKRTAKYNSLSGWRLNALKDPAFGRVADGVYKVTFDVLLSNVIWFTGNRVTISNKADIPSYVSNDVSTLLSLVAHTCPDLKITGHIYSTHVI